MHRHSRSTPGDGSDGSAPSEAWLFAQAILGNPIPKRVNPATEARAARERLQRLADFSPRHADELRQLQAADAAARHDRRILEWAAQISTEAEDKLRALQRKEAAERAAWRRAEQFAETLLEGTWDASKHPRGAFPQNRGWWSPTGAAGGNASGNGSFQTAFSPTSQPQPQFSLASAEISRARPGYFPPIELPKIGLGAGAAARAAGGAVAGSLGGALGNAGMVSYWGRIPASEGMRLTWWPELEQRVRAGTLSKADAEGIYQTAVLGAQAQGFVPTGGTRSALRKSALDFLGKAEGVYFARKKQKGWAVQPGGYQLSGGRVFPTKRNSGLDGYALRQEQEKFFERGLAEGKAPGYLRGQASEAGSKREGGINSPDDHLVDPEAEAALQRAIRRAAK